MSEFKLKGTFAHRPSSEHSVYIFLEDEVIGQVTSTDLSQLFVEAGNVRQRINCSLTELLEQRNELLEASQFALKVLAEELDNYAKTDAVDKLDEAINKCQ